MARWTRCAVAAMAAVLFHALPARAVDRGDCRQNVCSQGDVSCDDTCHVDGANYGQMSCRAATGGRCCVFQESSVVIGARVNFFEHITYRVRTDYVCPSGSRTFVSERCEDDLVGVCLASTLSCCETLVGGACGGAQGC
jgi:hypothetical protein